MTVAAAGRAGAAEQDHEPESAAGRVRVHAGRQGRRGDGHGAAELWGHLFAVRANLRARHHRD